MISPVRIAWCPPPTGPAWLARHLTFGDRPPWQEVDRRARDPFARLVELVGPVLADRRTAPHRDQERSRR